MSQTAIPGYTYGSSAVPRSPQSLADFERLKQSVLFSDEVSQSLRLSYDVLKDQTQALVEESVKRGNRTGGKSRVASMLPHLIQELVLLGQMALQQDDAVTACSLLEASATLAKQMGEGQDCAEPFSLLAWAAALPVRKLQSVPTPKPPVVSSTELTTRDVRCCGSSQMD